jgi:hypothetical protein
MWKVPCVPPYADSTDLEQCSFRERADPAECRVGMTWIVGNALLAPDPTTWRGVGIVMKVHDSTGIFGGRRRPRR